MPLRGKVRVPSDKSISHRAVLFSAMAQGTSRLENVLPSDDVLSSVAAASALGARVELSPGACGLHGTICGFGGKVPAGTHVDIDCGNSGTTTRLLLGLLAGVGAQARLTGDESLSRRPMGRVMEPLRSMGARFSSDDGTLPVRVLPHEGLVGISYESPVASAQVKSAVLLAGLGARGRTSVTEPAKSRDHTELMLPAYGVDVEIDGLAVSLEGPACLRPHDVSVPADPSSAAFVAVAAALVEGSDVCIEQVALNPTRTGAFEVMRRMGVCLEYANRRQLGAEPVGDVHVAWTAGLKATTIEACEVPALIDEVPVLALLAAAADGSTVFKGVGELRVKESDRFAAVRSMLGAFGVETMEFGDDLHVVGSSLHAPGAVVELESHHDHRLAMCYRIAELAAGAQVIVDDPECVSVSWPSFYEDIAALVS